MTNEMRAEEHNKLNSTAWNGSLGWTYGPPALFVVVLIVIAISSVF